MGELGCRHSLSPRLQGVADRTHAVACQTRKMSSGYNCKAYVWNGRTDFHVLTVFDTGATRGSVDSEFLKN